MNNKNLFPDGFEPLETQVAGHVYDPSANSVGILQQNNEKYVFKPLGKPMCGASEVNFYTTLQSTEEAMLVRLREFVPSFFGTATLEYDQKQIEFIKLENLTYELEQPCVMDVKIGKRTWDPLASEEKIASERSKYADCKASLGFCIPGFQVHDLKTNELKRFGKKYGKMLNNQTVHNAFEIFFNLHVQGSYNVIKSVLRTLYDIQKWSKQQTLFKLYSSSVLIIYDAKRLLDCSKKNKYQNGIHSNAKDVGNDVGGNESLLENGSYIHYMSDSISSNSLGVKVKMIDFAHVFPGEDNCIDSNYLFGIEHLIKMLESLLKD